MPTSSDGKVQVDIVANKKPFEQGLREVDSTAGKIGGKIAGKLGALFSAAALGAFGKQCVELASDLNEVQNVVDVTFTTMSGKVDEWARNAADRFGLSETMAKRYVGTFGSMAEAFGFTEEQAYKMSTALTGLAGDVASFYNITQDEAYTKLKGVFSGETESLKELGIVMTQSALDQYAMAHGFGKTTKEMSEQEKVALRLAFVQANLANATGDFQRTSGSWANQVRVLTLRFDQFKATIGQSLIAVLLPVVKLLNAIILGATRAAEAFNRMVEQVTGKSMAELTGGAQSTGAAVADLGTASEDAADSSGTLALAQADAAKAAKKQEKAQKALNRTLAGFDRINKLASREKAESTSSDTGLADAALPSAGGAGMLATLGDTVAEQTEKAQGALDKLKLPQGLIDAAGRLGEKFERLAKIVGEGLQWVWDNILEPFAKWFVNEAMPPVVDIIGSIVSIVGNVFEIGGKAFGPIWEKLLKPIAKLLGEYIIANLEQMAKNLRAFADWLEKHTDQFAKPFQDLADLLGELGDEVVKISVIAQKKGPVAAVLQIFEDIKNDKRPLPERLETLLSAVGAVVGPVGAVKNIFDWAKVNLVPRAASVVATVRGAITAGFDKVKSAFKWARSALSDFAGTIKAAVTGKFPGESAWRKITDAFAWAKNKLINKARTISATVKSTISSTWEAARKQFEWAAKHLKDIKAKISLTLDAAISDIKGLVNGVIAKINQKLHYLRWPRLDVGGISVGGGQLFPGYSASRPIPQLAQGGFVGRNTPRLAVIGDNRREGEIVSPESKLQAMADKAAQGGGWERLLPVLNAILAAIQDQDRGVYLDGQAITRHVVTGINRQTRATGRNPLVI